MTIDAYNVEVGTMSFETIQSDAPARTLRKISINDGSNVNGVERKTQSLDVTSNIDLDKIQIHLFNCHY
jgi:hypothetical protein